MFAEFFFVFFFVHKIYVFSEKASDKYFFIPFKGKRGYHT